MNSADQQSNNMEITKHHKDRWVVDHARWGNESDISVMGNTCAPPWGNFSGVRNSYSTNANWARITTCRTPTPNRRAGPMTVSVGWIAQAKR